MFAWTWQKWLEMFALLLMGLWATTVATGCSIATANDGKAWVEFAWRIETGHSAAKTSDEESVISLEAKSLVEYIIDLGWASPPPKDPPPEPTDPTEPVIDGDDVTYKPDGGVYRPLTEMQVAAWRRSNGFAESLGPDAVWVPPGG